MGFFSQVIAESRRAAVPTNSSAASLKGNVNMPTAFDIFAGETGVAQSYQQSSADTSAPYSSATYSSAPYSQSESPLSESPSPNIDNAKHHSSSTPKQNTSTKKNLGEYGVDEPSSRGSFAKNNSSEQNRSDIKAKSLLVNNRDLIQRNLIHQNRAAQNVNSSEAVTEQARHGMSVNAGAGEIEQSASAEYSTQSRPTFETSMERNRSENGAAKGASARADSQSPSTMEPLDRSTRSTLAKSMNTGKTTASKTHTADARQGHPNVNEQSSSQTSYATKSYATKTNQLASTQSESQHKSSRNESPTSKQLHVQLRQQDTRRENKSSASTIDYQRSSTLGLNAQAQAKSIVQNTPQVKIGQVNVIVETVKPQRQNGERPSRQYDNDSRLFLRGL